MMKIKTDITFDTIVRQYRARQPDHFIENCQSQANLKMAIEIASKSIDRDSKKHDHQRHISPIILSSFAEKLKLKEQEILNVLSFDELFYIVDNTSCCGIGELAKYDISKRIGEFLNIFPDKVFLHRGTRVGAKHLLGHLRDNKILTLDELPPVFQEKNLTASEIEDILCIYKDNFKNMMKKNIELNYHQVPKEMIEDFKASLDESISLSVSNKKLEYSNFIGGPADIIIFIDEHLTELIIGGLLVNATYDGLKYAIQMLWKKFVKLYSNQKNTFQPDKNYIEIKFKIKPNKAIEFDLNGDIDAKLIENLTNNIFNYLRNKKQFKKDFKNPHFKEASFTEPRLKMKLNTKTKNWDPVDYVLSKKQFKELLDQASKKFRS